MVVGASSCLPIKEFYNKVKNMSGALHGPNSLTLSFLLFLAVVCLVSKHAEAKVCIL
jgi:hypothetical protein